MDRVGMFVRRSSDGAGTTTVQNVKAVWDFTANGLSKNGKVKVQAFGVEMVYVAEGAFKVGSGGTEHSRLYQHTDGSQDTLPYQVTSTNAILTGKQNGRLAGAQEAPPAATIPSSFPNGYAAFYCMKYSITQGQYADFLNTLTRAHQERRFASTTVSNFMHSGAAQTTPASRNGVRLIADPGEPLPRVYANDFNTSNPPNSFDDGRDLACNWLSWADGAAFADWAGLRPVTELEIEKACRGPLEPVANEYAFGASTFNQISGVLAGGTDGSGTEYYTAGNLHVSGSGGPGGPVRVGIFAKASSSRVSAGASYWGIMELSGNVWDRAVTVGNGTGRAFTGLHGNGVLTTSGNADVSAWPGTGAGGAGMRGSNWIIQSADRARVSDRNHAAHGRHERHFGSHYDAWGLGGRAVRSAPPQ